MLLIIGATAAMALPPQIAVPEAISNEVFLSTFKSFPRAIPKNITTVTEMIVSINPVFEDAITSLKLIPNPIKTIDVCKIFDVYLCKLSFLMPIKENTKPINSAKAGEINGIKQSAITIG